MMRRRIQMSLLLALSAAALPAEWLFTRPRNAALYDGRHMEPTNVYSVLRREDVAWIEEAAAEREAMRGRSWTGLVEVVELVPQFGSWPLSESNRFERWVAAVRPGLAAGTFLTNIVVGYCYATNHGAGADSARYAWDRGRWTPELPGGLLDAGGDWLALDNAAYTPTNCVLTRDEDEGGVRLAAPVTYTNVATSVTTNYSMSALATNMTIYARTLTNGVVVAHTNLWTEMLPRISTNAVTNVVALSWQGMMFTNFVVNAYESARPDFAGRRFHLSNYTNYLHWLGGMTRLADMTFPTNAVMGLYSYSTDVLGDHYDGYSYSTNTIDAVHPIRRLQNRHTSVTSGYEGESWETNEQGTVIYHPGRGRYYDSREEWYEDASLYALGGAALFPARITAAAATNGCVNRVRRARLYACAEMSLDRYDYGHDVCADESALPPFGYDCHTSRVWRAVRHVGDAAYAGASADGRALFAAWIDYQSVAQSMAALAGLSFAPRGEYAETTLPVSAPSGGGTPEYESTRSRSETLDVRITDFILLYDFQWTTDLSGW